MSRQREYYHRNREAINQRRRERYQQAKGVRRLFPETIDDDANDYDTIKQKPANDFNSCKTRLLQMIDDEVERKIKEVVKQNVLEFPMSDEAFDRFTSQQESVCENCQTKNLAENYVKPIDWQRLNWLAITIFCLANTGLLIFDSADFFLTKGLGDIKAWGYAGLSEVGILLITALAAKTRDQATKVGYLLMLGIAILLQGFVVHSSIDQKGRQVASNLVAENQESKIVLAMVEQLQASVSAVQEDIDKLDPGRNKTAREQLLAKKQDLLDQIEQRRSQLQNTKASLGDIIGVTQVETTLVQWVRWFQLLVGVVLVHWLVKSGRKTPTH